jgi:hypothetical protein
MRRVWGFDHEIGISRSKNVVDSEVEDGMTDISISICGFFVFESDEGRA